MQSVNNNIDWTNAVKRKIQDAKKPVPAGSWDAIASAIGSKPVVNARHNVRRLWLSAAAAAVVAALITMGILLTPNSNNSITPRQSQPATAQTPTANKAGNTITPPSIPSSQASAFTGYIAQNNTASNRGSVAQQLQESTIDTEMPVVAKTDDKTSQPAKTEAEPKQAENKAKESKPEAREPFTSGKVSENRTYYDNDEFYHKSRKQNANRKDYALNVYGSGVVLAAGNSQDAGTRNMLVVSQSNGIIYDARRPVVYKYNHKLPVNIGITLNKRITGNLIGVTGLTYSALYSDVIPDDGSAKFTQRVRFIGIPAGLKWNFWHMGHFETYVGGEALVERCIDARFGDNKVTERRLQWSVHATAGAQYKLSDNIGVYVEPKLSHYITSFPLTTIRNEHSVNINVQFGLSLSF
jgi:hypothetical protein